MIAVASSPSLANTFGTLYISSNTTLTENHEGDVVITTDDVTLDCGGTSFQLIFPWVFRLENRTNVTVQNCHVSGVGPGFPGSELGGERLVRQYGKSERVRIRPGGRVW
jgi:hypothetical protein